MKFQTDEDYTYLVKILEKVNEINPYVTRGIKNATLKYEWENEKIWIKIFYKRQKSKHVW